MLLRVSFSSDLWPSMSFSVSLQNCTDYIEIIIMKTKLKMEIDNEDHNENINGMRRRNGGYGCAFLVVGFYP